MNLCRCTLSLLAMSSLGCQRPAPTVAPAAAHQQPEAATVPVATITLTHIGSAEATYPPDYFSPDGRYTAYDQTSTCDIYEDGTFVGSVSSAEARLHGYAYPCTAWVEPWLGRRLSRDGRVVATVEPGAVVVDDGAQRVRIAVQRVQAMALDPQGGRVATVDVDGRFDVWDVATQAKLSRIALDDVVPGRDTETEVQLAWPDKDVVLLLPQEQDTPLCEDLYDEDPESDDACRGYGELEQPILEVSWSPTTGFGAKELIQHFAEETAVLDPVSGCTYWQFGSADDRAGYNSEWQGCDIHGSVFEDSEIGAMVRALSNAEEMDSESRDSTLTWTDGQAPVLVSEETCESCVPAEYTVTATEVPSLEQDELSAPEDLRSFECTVYGIDDDGGLVASCSACPMDPDYDEDDEDWKDDDELPPCTESPAIAPDCYSQEISPDGRWDVRECTEGKGDVVIVQPLPTGGPKRLGTDPDLYATWTRESSLWVQEADGLVLRRGPKLAVAHRIEGGSLVAATLARQLGLEVITVADRLQIVRTEDLTVVFELGRPSTKPISSAALDQGGARLAAIVDGRIHMVDLADGQWSEAIAAPTVKHLAWSQDGRVLFGGATSGAPERAWTRQGTVTELPVALVKVDGALDPTWRWSATEEYFVRVIDGAELWVDDDGLVIPETGLFDGAHELLEDLVFSAGNDPLCSPILHAADHPDLFERTDLAELFFSGAPLPNALVVPLDHEALEPRCEPSPPK